MLHNLNLQDKYLELSLMLQKTQDLCVDLELDMEDDDLANHIFQEIGKYIAKLESQMENHESLAKLSFSDLVG